MCTALTCNTSLKEHTRVARAFGQAISDMCCQNKLATAIEPQSKCQRQSFTVTSARCGLLLLILPQQLSLRIRPRYLVTMDAPLLCDLLEQTLCSCRASCKLQLELELPNGSQPWSHSMAVPVVADWGISGTVWMARYQFHVQLLA